MGMNLVVYRQRRHTGPSLSQHPACSSPPKSATSVHPTPANTMPTAQAAAPSSIPHLAFLPSNQQINSTLMLRHRLCYTRDRPPRLRSGAGKVYDRASPSARRPWRHRKCSRAHHRRTSAISAIRSSQGLAHLRPTRRSTLVRSSTCVTCVARLSFRLPISKLISGFIAGRNLSDATSVGKDFHR